MTGVVVDLQSDQKIFGTTAPPAEVLPFREVSRGTDFTDFLFEEEDEDEAALEEELVSSEYSGSSPRNFSM